jgi:anaerobic selenocysteine-containing dehydrogenase/Fe-S-cluster-containing dehydrogenase component
MNRRRFLKVLGVTGGGATALSGCSTDKVEKLIPYLVPPTSEIPGVATWYASTCRECPAGCGFHVKVREGRAVKVEGNPDNPVNRGKLCSRGQAATQGLYNPDRVRGPLARAADGTLEPISWDDAIARITERLASAEREHVWFVMGNETGSFDRLVAEWLAALGANPRIVYEPFGYEALRLGNRSVFGTDSLPSYDLAAARYVLSFGADFLETWLSPVEQARQFAEGHSYHDGEMGRYVHVEPRMSMSGMNADEWIAPVPGTEGLLALGIAHVIVRDRLADLPSDISRVQSLLGEHDPATVSNAAGVPAETVERLAREFTASVSVALAGAVGAQHAEAHATAAAVNILNYVAGNVGRTVTFGADINPAGESSYAGLASLVGAMQDGRVSALFVHGANPAYATPGELGFAGAMRGVEFKVSFARFMDETAAEADLILPDHDPLEQWNDFEPRVGVRALQQPVMQPVFDTRQTGDVLLAVAAQLGGSVASTFTAASYKDYLQAGWRAVQRDVGDRSPFETFWTSTLQQGGVWTEAPTRPVRLAAGAGTAAGAAWSAPGDDEFTLIAYPSTNLFDGRGANRPWLQEVPDPVTKVTWDACVEIHPERAAELGIAAGDLVEVTSQHGSVTVPAYLYPGLRRDVVAMPIGQGHTEFGRYATDLGASAFDLLGAQATEFGGMGHYTAVTLRHANRHERLANPEGRTRQMGRGIAQATTLAALTHPEEQHEEEHAEHAAPVPEHVEEVLEQWQEAQYDEWRQRGNYAVEDLPNWSMNIDLSKCTGCSACVTACYAENNIPTVGRRLMIRERGMAWMRIERYFEGGEGDEPLETRVLPMLCQHCGNAPCEPVCPVFAAYHTADGLNAQVYNRCVGTRYCSNNCPYKVRYFNWFDHSNENDPAHSWPDPLHWLLNPDVTVRSKGVMEKCTFCVQRIRARQNEAKLSGEEIVDGDIVTACQQSCPSNAIVFGDINDQNSRIRALAQDARAYSVLDGLNTRPSVTYLKKVRNTATD